MKEMHQQFWYRLIKRLSLLLSLEATLAIIISYYAGSWVGQYFHFGTSQINGLWCAISAIIVLQILLHESYSAAWTRALGSFVGAFTGFVFATWMGYTILALSICIFITVMLTSLFKIRDVFRLACLTAAIIIIVGSLEPTVPPFINAIARFIESAVGSSIAIAITAIFYPLRKKLDFLRK